MFGSMALIVLPTKHNQALHKLCPPFVTTRPSIMRLEIACDLGSRKGFVVIAPEGARSPITDFGTLDDLGA